MPVAARLVDVEQVKTHLGKVDNDQDPIIAQIIEGVSDMIESELGEPIIGTADVSDALCGNGFAVVTATRRIRSVTSVVEGTETLTSSDYRIDGARTITRLSSGLSSTWAAGDVIVTYKPGFSSVPRDLRHAAMIQSVFEYKQTKAGGDRLGLTSNSPGGEGESVSYITHELLPEVRRIIEKRRAF